MKPIILTEQDIRDIVYRCAKQIISERNNVKTSLNLETLISYLTMPYGEKMLYNAECHYDDFCQYLKLKNIKVRPSRKAVQQYKEYVNGYTNMILNSRTEDIIIPGIDISVVRQNSNLFLKYLQNSEGWLAHFTKEPLGIINNGFLGIQNINDIHRTFNRSMVRRSLNSGYAFAYDINTIPRYDFEFNTNYVVFFKANGVIVEHLIDREKQVIFDAGNVDHTNIVVAKLEKNITSYYDENGDVEADSEINGVNLIYPASVKGKKFSTVKDVLSWLNNGGAPDMRPTEMNPDIQAILDYFSELPQGDENYIRKTIDEIEIHYRYYADDGFNHLVPQKFFLRPVINFITSLGFKETEKHREFTKEGTTISFNIDYGYISVNIEFY